MNKQTYKYHPVRYAKHMRPVLDQVIDEFYNHDPEERAKGMGILLGVIFESVVSRLIEGNKQLFLMEDIGEWSEYQAEAFDFFDRYLAFGENIFHIQPALVEMFKRTDVDDVVINQLKVPFEAIYLYFGNSANLKVGGNNFEGAYIISDVEESSMMVCFTTSSPTIDYSTQLNPSDFLMSDNHLYFVLATDPGGTVGDAISSSMQEFASHTHLTKRFDAWKDSFSEAIRLLMNSLCYLGSPHCDVNERLSDETPKLMVRKIKSATSEKQRVRALSKAKSQGFRVIKFVGDGIERELSASVGIGQISPHWRRGHWRNQAFGHERKDHKLIWIQPTIVKKESSEVVKAKHLYDVDTKSG